MPPEFGGWALAGPGWLFTALAVVLLLTGKLYTKAHVEQLIKQRDDRINEKAEEASRWMQAFVVSQEENGELREHLNTSLEQGETMLEILRSIKDGGHHGQD